MSPSTGQHNSCRRLQHHKSKVSTAREQLAHLQIIVIINHADFTPFKRVLGELCVQAALAPGARGPGLCVPCFDAAEPHTMGQNQRECPVNAVPIIYHHQMHLYSAGLVFAVICFHHIHMLYFQIMMQNMDYKQIALTLNSDWMRSAPSQRSPVIVYVTLDYKTRHKGHFFFNSDL